MRKANEFSTAYQFHNFLLKNVGNLVSINCQLYLLSKEEFDMFEHRTCILLEVRRCYHDHYVAFERSAELLQVDAVTHQAYSSIKCQIRVLLHEREYWITVADYDVEVINE
jgi:hypothetical protein